MHDRKYCKAEHGSLLAAIVLFFFSVCDTGVPILEDKVENLNIPSFSVSGVKVSR